MIKANFNFIKKIQFEYKIEECRHCNHIANYIKNKQIGMYLCSKCNNFFCHDCWKNKGSYFAEIYTYIDNWIEELDHNNAKQAQPVNKEHVAVCSVECTK